MIARLLRGSAETGLAWARRRPRRDDEWPLFASKARASTALLLAVFAVTAQAGVLSGRVADATGVHGINGAQVSIEGSSRRETTDASGAFRFSGLPGGRYTIVVRYTDTLPARQTIEVSDEGVTTTELRLEPIAGLTEEMIVIGQRASQASALSQQRFAESISSFLTKDAIGQFPDQNVSEAVRRLSGVSVQNDQGEGRFIVLRGLDPNLNSASLNGVRVTAPESDIRAVALDVVPAELVESIEVQKSLTPEMDGDAIGGAINIRTTSALDRKGAFLSVTATGSYNELMDVWSPKIGVDASTVFNERLGVSLGLSYFDRQLGSDNVEAEDWTDAEGIVYAEGIELRDYDVTRTRIGGTLGLDFLASDTTRLFARGVYSSFEDQEFRSILAADFGDADPVSGGADSATFSLTGDEELEVVRNIKDRNEKQEIVSLLLGGETIVDAWTLNYDWSFTQSEEDESDSPDTVDFARTFEAGELTLSQLQTGSSPIDLRAAAESLSDFNDASSYEYDGVEFVNGIAEDDEYAFRVDVARQLAFGDAQVELKSGVRGRLREKTYDLDLALYEDFEGEGEFLLSDVATTVDYPLSELGPVPSADAVRAILGDFSDFELNEVETLFENAGASYNVNEDIFAGYLQATVESGRWLLVGGARVEHTRDDIKGNRVELVEEGAEFGGVTLPEDITFVTPVSFTKSDTQWLPSLNLRFAAADDVVLRAAAYRSLFRPNMEDLAPRFVVEQSQDGREGEFGNPSLDPYVAWNLDAGAAWYFDDNAVLQAGVFYKDIEDYIFRLTLQDVDFNGVFVDEGVIPLNGDEAQVLGVEVNYQQVLDKLPGLLSGLLLGANYTYVDSEGTLNGRTVALPGTSEHVVNLVLGYEKGPVSLRLAWSYRDEYLDELSEDGETDIFIDENGQLDFSAKYNFSPKAQLFVEAINITDEPRESFVRTPAYGDRMIQYEEYSFTINVGFRATL